MHSCQIGEANSTFKLGFGTIVASDKRLSPLSSLHKSFHSGVYRSQPIFAFFRAYHCIENCIATVNLSITLEQPSKKLALFGSADRHLRLIRDAFGVQVVNRDDELRLSG